ncbi:hypothetical protein HDU67_007480 [Dinochytrium kinnereticum]|nr:hypothetical protein HDU67_007480 [Dinochytrium kinnereticum]
MVVDFAVRTSDAFDGGFLMTAWAPSGTSKSHGCLLGRVSLANRVAIYEATEDPSTGYWEEIQDLTEDLITFCTTDERADYSNEMQLEMFESLSIGWSEQDFYPSGGYEKPFVLLAIGSKAGVVTVWSLNPFSRKVVRDCFLAPCSYYIRDIAWSSWRNTDSADNDCLLALAAGDQSVYVYKVTRLCNGETASYLYHMLNRFDLSGMGPISILKFSKTEDRRLAIGAGQYLAMAWISPDPTSPPENDHITDLLLPVEMAISGLVWGTNGEYLRAYSQDGKAFIIEVSPAYELSILDDITLSVYESLLADTKNEAVTALGEGEDGRGDEKTPLADIKVRFYGACSVNGVVDAVLSSLSKKHFMGYRTEKDECCIVTLCKHYVVGDEESETLFVDHIEDALHDPFILLRCSSNFLLYEALDYCYTSINTPNQSGLPAFPLKLLFWLYEKSQAPEPEAMQVDASEKSLAQSIILMQRLVLCSPKMNAARLFLVIAQSLRVDARKDGKDERKAYQTYYKRLSKTSSGISQQLPSSPRCKISLRVVSNRRAHHIPYL